MNNPELGALLMVKSSQARELGIRLETAELNDFSAVDAASFSGDLVTVIGNLVDNALEACSAGDRIVVTLARDDEELVVAVEDNGPGIAPHLLPTLFIEGVSSKTTPRPGDANRRLHRRGIGLALVRRVAHRHHGEASAGRGSLCGAVFTVRLPLVSPDSRATRSR